jgi:HD-GYP domain-containing protein (c-di-GMP phosphodiesterase class II)
MAEPFEVVVRGTDRVHQIGDGMRVTVGRVPQCEIHLDDQAVSRRHCTIEGRGRELVVTDLASVNGTFVNERSIKSASVRGGDIIRVGSSILDVRDRGQPRTGVEAVWGAEESSTIESVIQKRFEPSQFEWLATATSGAVAERTLLQRAQRHLETLHRVSEMLAGTRDIGGVSDSTLRAILEVTAADRAALVLRRQDPETGGVEVAAARARIASEEEFTVSRTLVSDVINKGISTFAHDASSDARFADGHSVVAQRVRSVMCVPLRTSDEILGALYVDSLSGAGRFNEADLELLAAIGNQAGVALHRVRLMGELARLLIDTIRAIAATIDAKDGYTHRHSERVAELARRIAGEMGLSAEEQQTAELSALLHDVGKIAVPDSILNKPERLTSEEFAEMKKHPLHGARILSNIQSASVRAVVPGVQYHHEKWDGTGYPEGLAGEEIPLLGRLLGVADFLDALTSRRAYRPPMTVDDAIALIVQGAGTHFDPEVASAVVRLHERGELLPPEWDGVIDSTGTQRLLD